MTPPAPSAGGWGQFIRTEITSKRKKRGESQTANNVKPKSKSNEKGD
jgi:hypothetical protein